MKPNRLQKILFDHLPKGNAGWVKTQKMFYPY